MRSIFVGSIALILLILSNTQYFSVIDTDYTKEYEVFSGGRHCYTKHYAVVL